MKKVLPLLLVGFVCGGLPPAADAEERMRTVLQGNQSGIQKAAREVVVNQEAWEKLWKSHRGNVKGGDPAPPKVDWSREMVLATFMGARPTGGFAVRITGAAEEKGKLVVSVAERKPGPNDLVTQAFTSPFCIVSVPKSEKPVEWKSVDWKTVEGK